MTKFLSHDLRHYRAPFRLSDYFRGRDVAWLCVAAILILELVLR